LDDSYTSIESFCEEKKLSDSLVEYEKQLDTDEKNRTSSFSSDSMVEYEEQLDTDENNNTSSFSSEHFSQYQERTKEEIPQSQNEKAYILKNLNELNFKVAGTYISIIKYDFFF